MPAFCVSVPAFCVSVCVLVGEAFRVYEFRVDGFKA